MDTLPTNPNYATNEQRVKNRKKLVEIIESHMITKDNADWNDAMLGAKFPYGPVNPLKKVFEDPQVLHNQMVREMTHDHIGPIKQV